MKAEQEPIGVSLPKTLQEQLEEEHVKFQRSMLRGLNAVHAYVQKEQEVKEQINQKLDELLKLFEKPTNED